MSIKSAWKSIPDSTWGALAATLILVFMAFLIYLTCTPEIKLVEYQVTSINGKTSYTIRKYRNGCGPKNSFNHDEKWTVISCTDGERR
jgi:hypothetical protein